MQIQITNEISDRLASLRDAVGACTNFGQAKQLIFENTDFPVLTGYQNVIEKVVLLGEYYRAMLEQNISACEQTIENNRAMDQQIGQAMRSVI